MSIYFISDLHLSDHQPHLQKLFDHFIQNILKANDKLYILGDLFEYWIGDDQDSVTANKAKQLLTDLQQRQIAWFFLAGNRDFLLRDKFLNATHGELLPEKTLIEIDGKRVLLLHGDTLCTHDLGYQAWRRKVQKKWLQNLFLALPLAWRKKIANRMREKSMAAGQCLDEAMMNVAQSTVLEEFHFFKAQIMIHGHVHRPGVHGYWDEASGQWLWRYVLADWDEKANYLRYDGQQFDLCYFDLRN